MSQEKEQGREVMSLQLIHKGASFWEPGCFSDLEAQQAQVESDKHIYLETKNYKEHSKYFLLKFEQNR